MKSRRNFSENNKIKNIVGSAKVQSAVTGLDIFCSKFEEFSSHKSDFFQLKGNDNHL